MDYKEVKKFIRDTLQIDLYLTQKEILQIELLSLLKCRLIHLRNNTLV